MTQLLDTQLPSAATGSSQYSRPSPLPALTQRAELAVLARVLYSEGYNDHASGHITYRQRDDTFLTLPPQFGWDEAQACHIMRIDGDGNILEGDWDITGAINLHLEMHRLRPEAGVVVHNHPQYATIYAAAHRVPPAYDQLSALIADDEIVVYDDYRGTVSSREIARRNCEAMGSRNYALLANHGVMVIGASAAQAYSNAMALEWRCKQAWHVEAIGGGHPMIAAGQEALRARMKAWPEGRPAFMWEWAARRQIHADPRVLT